MHILGGIDIVSCNLVRCNQQMISSSPSIISTLMQNFSNGQGDVTDKNKSFEVDNTEGLQSFAHLGMYLGSLYRNNKFYELSVLKAVRMGKSCDGFVW